MGVVLDPRSRSAAEPEGAPYLPFDNGRFRLAMGLMPLAPSGWIEIDAHLGHDLAAKRALLETRHAEVFAGLPEAAAPAAELLSMLVAHLPRYHPEIFRRTRDLLDNMISGERWDGICPVSTASRRSPMMLRRDEAGRWT